MARRVRWVEGEKDADRAWSLGLPATTCGSVDDWRRHAEDYLGQLVAMGCRELVVIPDNDDPGRRHARAVVRGAIESGLRVKCLELPGLSEKGDLSDYFDAGHTKDEYLALEDAAPWLEEPIPEPEPTRTHPEPGPPDPGWPDTGSYLVRNGVMCRMKRNGDGGEWAEPLCNFRARVPEELLLDDGIQQTRAVVIEGWMEDHAPLPTLRVPATKFHAMAWVMEQWGLRPVLKAGQSNKDYVREAIQRLSRPAFRRLYTHTGWRQVDGVWVYLSASGAVGREGVEVDLGKFSRYRLPAQPERVREAVALSLSTLGLAPLRVTVPLLGSVYRALLGEILRVDYSLWLEGQTQNYKSSLAAVFLSHWGYFERLNLPENWSSTANALERGAFTLKDAWLVIDDFHPTADNREQDVKAARLIRSQGNLTGRGRLRQDLGDQTVMPPRGLLVGTGEQHPGGQSLVGRMLILEIDAAAINLQRLTGLQRSIGLLPSAISGFCQWLSPQWGTVHEAVLERFDQARTAAIEAAGRHARIPEIIANCWVGFTALLDFARDVEALSEIEASGLRDRGWEALLGAAEGQSVAVEEERPSRRFFSMFQSSLLQRRVALLTKDQVPESLKPPPDFVGWHDETHLYLDPCVFHAVARVARDSGEPFPLRQIRLYKDFAKEGLTEIRDSGHTTYPITVGGKQRRVLVLPKIAVNTLLGVPFHVPDVLRPETSLDTRRYQDDNPF